MGRLLGVGASGNAQVSGGAWSNAVARTLARAGSALADPTVSARDAVVILLAHLEIQERTISDAVNGQQPLDVSRAAYRASSLRLRRMLLILLRMDRRNRRADEPTLRRSLGRQLKAHADVERVLIASIEAQLRPTTALALAASYERLLADALADPNSAHVFRAGRLNWLGRTAVLRAARRANSRRVSRLVQMSQAGTQHDD
jgi:hypothetical protein